MPLGWSFSWSFYQVNKFMSLLSASFSHFLHCCVWSSPSHLLAVLCVVILFPPFMGVGCVRMELQRMWNTCNIMRLIVLMVFFCSPHCHCLFLVISHVNMHGHLLIIFLHYCALRSCSPFYGVWVCRDGAKRRAKLLQHHKVDLLNLLFNWTNLSSHCHCFFWVISCVVVHDHFLIIYLHYCESLLSLPHFEGVWRWHSHSRNGDLGVLQDSQKLRVQLQGSKHLALRCSLYRWKCLEV
jgi:hypothetical protein